ncbi:MAG: CCA tRNA nucleotidyltransferase [Phycisphaera sp.]|nr:CCA tRNA nucleotidyltransferase [Phycisphaera sp.]
MGKPKRQVDARGAAEEVVRVLQQHGHEAFFAGGCVRDVVLGAEPSDYDVATDAPPDRVKELFKIARYVGEAFGVVMVKVRGAWIEVATFRMEWGYSDGRRPDNVEFSDAEADARRRDFTINGMFYDPVTDRVIDFVNGGADLEAKVIRAIGDPHLRFGEDYLRMLRAVRFAARLGFSIEADTAAAIRAHAGSLAQISRERIGMEVRTMLEHRTRTDAVRLMQDLGLDAAVLNESNLARTPVAMSSLATLADYPTALAAWLLDRHLDPELPDDDAALAEALKRLKALQIVRRWRKALVLSNEDRDVLLSALTHVPTMLGWFELPVARRKRLLARDDWMQVRWTLAAALSLSEQSAFDTALLDAQVAELEHEGVAPEPLITGDDLIAMGMEPGPAFKRLLDDVYDAQLEGRVVDKAEAAELVRELTA